MSVVFSILKCEFGWNGIVPESMSEHEIDWIMEEPGSASVMADKIGLLLAANGATFRERIDGKRNTRRIVGGVVLRAGRG